MSNPNFPPPSSVSTPRSTGRVALDRRVLDRFGPVLGPSGLAVYVALARFSHPQGPCTMSLFELAKRVGASRRQVLQALAKLESLGLIRTERHIGYTNRYHLRPLSTSLSNFPQPVPERDGEPSPAAPPPVSSRDEEVSHSAPPPVPPQDGGRASSTPRGVPSRDGGGSTMAPPPPRGESETGENSPSSASPTPPLPALKNIKKPGPEGGMGETTASAALLAQLTGHGVNEPKARWLVEHHSPKVIATQLNYLPHRRNMRDPAAALVRSIQEDWEEPEGHRLQRLRVREQEKYRQEERQRIRNGETAQAEREVWEHRKAALPTEQLATLQGQAEATVRRKLARVWPADKPLPKPFVEAELRSLVRSAADNPPPDPSKEP